MRTRDLDNAVRKKIIEFLEGNQSPLLPTLREIGKAVNIKSTSTVAFHISVLEEEGRIERVPRVSRGVFLKQKPASQQNETG